VVAVIAGEVDQLCLVWLECGAPCSALAFNDRDNLSRLMFLRVVGLEIQTVKSLTKAILLMVLESLPVIRSAM
jgi:hypothetical protein